MQSKKVKKFLKNVEHDCGYYGSQINWFDSEKAVEIAEQEMIEKAVVAFKLVTCQTHNRCGCCKGSCIFVEEFINKLNT